MPPEDLLSQATAAAIAATGMPPAPAPAAVTTTTIPVAGPPPAAAAAPPPPATITLTPAEWAAHTAAQARIVELETANAVRDREAKDAEIKSLEAKGEIKKAVEAIRAQAQSDLEIERKKVKGIEERAQTYALEGELARALASHSLVENGAEQLTELIRKEFTVDGSGATFVVRSKDHRSVKEFVDAIMPTRFPHFLRAKNPAGGTAVRAGDADGSYRFGRTAAASRAQNPHGSDDGRPCERPRRSQRSSDEHGGAVRSRCTVASGVMLHGGASTLSSLSIFSSNSFSSRSSFSIVIRFRSSDKLAFEMSSRILA